jgi:O-antigen ligase
MSFLLVSISLMLIALVLSRSRGGLMSFLIALICLLAILIKSPRGYLGSHQVYMILGILLVLVVASVGKEISARFSYSVRDAPERFELWMDSLRIVRDFPCWGSGLGTYRDVLVNYRPAKDLVMVAGIPQPARVNYAHNDYLQLLVECGLIGFILLVWATIRTGIYLYRGLKESSDWESQILGWSLVSGIIALMCHGFVDFNFHIPANALIFCLYLALAMKLARRKESSQLSQLKK